jgi:heme oxygenase (mycobilin-producing)
MTVIKINAITVPADTADELAHRFAARAGAVDNADGFEGFELLKPTDGREQWLVLTRWRDEESFQAWLNSDSFAHGHRSAAERRGKAHRRSPRTARSGPTYALAGPVPSDPRSTHSRLRASYPREDGRASALRAANLHDGQATVGWLRDAHHPRRRRLTAPCGGIPS